jgi:hypothetical protein
MKLPSNINKGSKKNRYKRQKKDDIKRDTQNFEFHRNAPKIAGNCTTGNG